MATTLERQGFRAYALEGGYMAWYRAGYPIERKEATEALPLEVVCPECGVLHAAHLDDGTG